MVVVTANSYRSIRVSLTLISLEEGGYLFLDNRVVALFV
jgi:hypothetical protein